MIASFEARYRQTASLIIATIVLMLLGGCGAPSIPNSLIPSASSYFLTVKREAAGLRPGLTIRGSAVAIGRHDTRCILLTAAHVVRGATNIIVAPWLETATSLPGQGSAGRMVASSDATDLAVIEAPLVDTCHPAPLAKTQPPIGTQIMIFGHPLDNAGLLTFGHVGAYWNTLTPQGLLGVSDALVHPGTSGAGVFISDGSLIGIVEGLSDDELAPKTTDVRAAEKHPRHLSYFIPIGRARSIAPTIFDSARSQQRP